MAVAMTETNLKKLEQLNEELKTNIGKWTTLLSDLEKSLKDKTGTNFKQNYEKGKKACENVQTVVKIFQDEQKEMNALTTKVTEFIAGQRKANKE